MYRISFISLVITISLLVLIVFLTGCFTIIKESENRQQSNSPSPSQILRLTPPGTNQVIMEINEGKRFSWIKQRLEWERFQICMEDENTGVIVAQRRFPEERMILQMKLVVSERTIETIFIWRSPIANPHPLSPRRVEREWYIAYRDSDSFSKYSVAFSHGVHHLLHIPHQSLKFDQVSAESNIFERGYC